MGSTHILTALRAANLSLGILKVYCWLRPVANIPPKESKNFSTQTTIDVYHGYDNNVSNNIKKLFFTSAWWEKFPCLQCLPIAWFNASSYIQCYLITYRYTYTQTYCCTITRLTLCTTKLDYYWFPFFLSFWKVVSYYSLWQSPSRRRF